MKFEIKTIFLTLFKVVTLFHMTKNTKK